MPALSRSAFMASVFEAVKLMPTIESSPNSNVSYTQKSHPVQRAAKMSPAQTTIPRLPTRKARSIDSLTDSVEASSMATELAPKQTLNIIGVSP